MAEAGGGHREPRGEDRGGGGMEGVMEAFLSAVGALELLSEVSVVEGSGEAAGVLGGVVAGVASSAGLVSGSEEAAALSGSGDGVAAAGCSGLGSPSSVFSSAAGVGAGVDSAGVGLGPGGVGARLFCEAGRELVLLTADGRRDAAVEDSPGSAAGSGLVVSTSSSSVMAAPAPAAASCPDRLEGRRLSPSETETGVT